MFSVPTGSVDKKTNGVFTHYMMQPGSGTWDFLPSITYTGRADRFAWGAQVLGVVRMEEENDSGYRLGNVFQATGWGSYRFADWISASVRGLYTDEGQIEGTTTARITIRARPTFSTTTAARIGTSASASTRWCRAEPSRACGSRPSGCSRWTKM